MIIDSHTHLDGETEAGDLVLSMKEAKIEKSLVYAGEMFGCSNEKLLEKIAPFKECLFPVASISPFSKSKIAPKQVEKWLASKELYGLKFYTGYEHFYPADKIIRPYLKLAEKYDRPVIFHSGDTWNQAKGAKLKYAHPFNFDDLATDMPGLKIVIAHFGYPWVMDTAEIIYKNKNVFTDCSGLFYGKPEEGDRLVVKKAIADYFYYGGSAEKMLFGTDWGVASQDHYVKLMSELFTGTEDKEQIFYNNASKLFKLE